MLDLISLGCKLAGSSQINRDKSALFVPLNTGKSANPQNPQPLTKQEVAKITEWLDYVEERDPLERERVLLKCQSDQNALNMVLLELSSRL